MARRRESSSSSQGHSQRSPEIAHQAPVSRQVGTLIIGHEHEPPESAQTLHYKPKSDRTCSKLYNPKSDRISARCAHTIPQLIRIFCRPPARMSRDGTRTPSPVRAPARMSRDGIRTPSPVREPGQDSSAAVWQKPRIITRTGAGSSKLSSEI